MRCEKNVVSVLTDLGAEEVVAKSRSGKVEMLCDTNALSFEEISKEIATLGFKAIPPKATDG